MKGLAPIYSCSEKCGVMGQKTVVDNADKLEEANMPYVWHITLIPLVRPAVRVWPQRRQGHLCVGIGQHMSSVLVVILHLKMGYNGCCMGGAILVQIDKQKVRTNMMNNTILKLTLSSIAKFKLHVMQHEHNMKAHVHIESNINKHIKQLH